MLLAACALLPAPAEAQQSGTELRLSLQLPNRGDNAFVNRLASNCNVLVGAGRGFQVAPGSRRSRSDFATGTGPVTGALNIAGRSGETYITTRRAGWQVENLFERRKRPALFTGLGVALQGGTAFLTGRVARGRAQSLAARRVRLAAIRGAKFESGPLVDRRDQPVPNTFSFLVSGRLRVLAAMSRALNRVRCTGRRQVASRGFRPGFALGTLTVGVRPDRATGLAGDAAMRVSARTDAGDEVTVEAAAGSARNADGDLVAPIAAGAGVALACSAGTECAPSGGSYGLAGGFDLVFGGRRASVANLALSAAGSPGALQWSATGTLDGGPVTIATAAAGEPSLRFTAEFAQRAGAALGVASLEGQMAVGTRFTRTGPA